MGKNKKEGNFTYIQILDKTYTETTRVGVSDDKWDRDDTRTDHNIIGFKIVDENNYFDFEVKFNIDTNKEYYLLYVIYGTGDSFGRDDGQIEFVGFYENVNIAEENLKRIEEHYKKVKYDRKYDNYDLILLNEENKEYKIRPPWLGYFENMDEIYIEGLRLEPYIKRKSL